MNDFPATTRVRAEVFHPARIPGARDIRLGLVRPEVLSRRFGDEDEEACGG
jgi:hypothetical protein